MADARIAVAEFVRAELVGDGSHLKLTLVDMDGRTVVLSLPVPCLGTLLAALPRQQDPPAGSIGEVQAWRLDPAGAARPALTLTLQTSEGRVAAFYVTPGQIAGMATLATYGGLSAATARTVN